MFHPFRINFIVLALKIKIVKEVPTFLPISMLLIVVARFDVDDEITGVLLRVIRIVIFHVRIMRAVVIILMMVVMVMLVLLGWLGLLLLRLLLLLLMMRKMKVRRGVKGGQMTRVRARRRWCYAGVWDHGTPSGTGRVIPVRPVIFQRFLLWNTKRCFPKDWLAVDLSRWILPLNL